MAGIIVCDVNVRVFQVLEFFDPANQAAHAAERAKWELLVLERDHLRRLPKLLEEGRFFAVFRNYCESMTRWGLEFERSTPETYERLNIDREERQRAIARWRADGATVPSAWVMLQGRRYISSEFICLGYWIFSPPNDKDAGLDQERSYFDKEAQGALPDLLEIVVKLPRLPVAIRELVAGYKERFISYTHREDVAA